jgi:hypothetical protein
MDVKLIRALAFHLYLLSLAVCPKAHGPESAKPAREPNVRFRTSRPQSRPSEIDPWRSLFGGLACPGSGHSARSCAVANAPIYAVRSDGAAAPKQKSSSEAERARNWAPVR